MKSSKLIAELKTLESRREALAAEEQNAQRALEAARRALILRPAETAAAAAAQSTHTALSLAIETVDDDLARLRAQLSDAQATEAREANMRAMVDLAAIGTKAFADYQAIRAEANAALLAIAERLEAAIAALTEPRRRFLEVFTEFCPHAAMGAGWVDPNAERMRAEDAAVARLLNELRERGADTAAVQSAMFGPTSQIDNMDLQQRTVADEPLIFADLLYQLVNVARIHRQARSGAVVGIRVTGRPLPRGWDSKAAA